MKAIDVVVGVFIATAAGVVVGAFGALASELIFEWDSDSAIIVNFALVASVALFFGTRLGSPNPFGRKAPLRPIATGYGWIIVILFTASNSIVGAYMVGGVHGKAAAGLAAVCTLASCILTRYEVYIE
ncbi:hypothetical protein CL629_03835 [bacterium]|nr:hypothetical protein [bacterium]|tara:strand:+ start:22334 stop:22717 length:384 start_codon:yes stop_codon:yes gene_type:complete